LPIWPDASISGIGLVIGPGASTPSLLHDQRGRRVAID
jgi:hypothetical protein